MLTVEEPELGIDDAYAIQEAGIRLRLEDGERVIGGKLGFTSRAMQQAMGVDHPNYGWLTDAMLIHGGSVPLDRLIHPKAEPEIAFLLAADLRPPVSTEQVLAATAAVLPCLEIVDSRYLDFRFRAFDNIADNSSAGLLALGDPSPPDGFRLDLLGVTVWVDGALRFTAAGAAALDHPAAAVAWMANHCGRGLEAGDLVISGGLTPPVDLGDGMVVTAEFDRIGGITIHTG
jgi:2-keto-4-pentenoate hydratase